MLLETGSRLTKNGAACELVVVLPTFNEADNIEPILQRLQESLRYVRWEAVFVDDDSADGTANAVVSAADRHGNVRLIRRIGRRGLSTAVIEGALSSMAPFIAVMDSDMQHDETALTEMLNQIRRGDCDLVVGTRYANGGGTGDWSAARLRASRVATKLAHALTGTSLSDPMSGFFMVTREAFDSAVRNLSGQGFKILLDLTASSRTPLRVREVPYQFKQRQFGESKLDSYVALEYLLLLLDKAVGRYVPARFLLFTAVGGAGLLVHMSVLAASFQFIGLLFHTSQVSATLVAMTFNFFVNNFLTYRDKRIRGLHNLVRGLLTFYAVCSVGAIANVGIANYLIAADNEWWLAGIGGVLVGAVWNYATTSVLTWRSK